MPDILTVFDDLCEEEREKSTTYIIQRTANICKVPYGRVVRKLRQRAAQEKADERKA